MRRNRRTNSRFVYKRITQAVSVSAAAVFIALLLSNDVTWGQLLLSEAMPGYKQSISEPKLLSLNSGEKSFNEPFIIDQPQSEAEEVEAMLTNQPDERNLDIIGLENVIYQPESSEGKETSSTGSVIGLEGLSEGFDFQTLKNKLYVANPDTDITEADLDINAFTAADLTIGNEGDLPKVLVFNTHSNELFADSVDKSEGVLMLSKKLCEILNNKYGIRAVYTVGDFDTVDGKPQVTGAYERMEPKITKLLQENPSIEVVIDLHRDAVLGDKKLVTTINGKETAEIMFFNGMSKIYEDGVLKDIEWLPNPNLKTNLAFSFQMQMAAAKLYPGFARKIFLRAYRYSLHMLPKSLLIEIGAQTNTKEEALNSMEPLADMLAEVLLNK